MQTQDRTRTIVLGLSLLLSALIVVAYNHVVAAPIAQEDHATQEEHSTQEEHDAPDATTTAAESVIPESASVMGPIAAFTSPSDAELASLSDRAELHYPGNSRGTFGFGRDATQDEIDAWNIDVMPDGTGLPAGEGTVSEGAEIYAEHCAHCHGPDGTADTYAVVVKPFDPDADWPQTPRTVGNYWPYASTVFDYIKRAMPYDHPNTLSADQVYAVTAWVLYQNEIIAEDDVMNAETLSQVEMPAHDKFIPHDPREDYRFQ